MVDVEIIDAKNGQGSILVSADPEMCNCGTAGAGGIGAALAPAGHAVRLIAYITEVTCTILCCWIEWMNARQQAQHSSPSAAAYSWGQFRALAL